MSYVVDFVYRAPSEGRIHELLNQIDDDIYQLDRIEASYHRVGLSADNDPEYQRIANRARDRFLLAEDLAAQLGIGEEEEDREVKSPVILNGVTMAIKSRDPDFIEWAREQIELANLWNWE